MFELFLAHSKDDIGPFRELRRELHRAVAFKLKAHFFHRAHRFFRWVGILAGECACRFDLHFTVKDPTGLPHRPSAFPPWGFYRCCLCKQTTVHSFDAFSSPAATIRCPAALMILFMTARPIFSSCAWKYAASKPLFVDLRNVRKRAASASPASPAQRQYPAFGIDPFISRGTGRQPFYPAYYHYDTEN